MFTKISTAGMNRDEWRILRQTGIGGSDAGALCGLNAYVSPLNVYASKTGELEEEESKEAIRIGHDLEEYVAQRFTEATGLKVRRSNYMYRSVENPFMIADVDRLVVGEDAGLECKTTNAFGESNWKDGNIPPHYLMQCYHYMAVTRKRTWYIAALIMGRDFVYYKIDWDDDIISRLIEIERDFWNNHVCAEVLPNPDGSKAYTEMLNGYFDIKDFEKAMQLPQGFEEKIIRRENIEEQINELKAEKDKIDQEIKLAMGEREKAETEGYRISWKAVTSNRVNGTALKNNYPDVYKQCITTSVSRRFEIKQKESNDGKKVMEDGRKDNKAA